MLDFGVERFNAACRSLVLRYTAEWQRYVTRQARWVDFEHDYKTMDLPYMESVLWAFKQLYDRGLAYEGNRVLPYCWECETPLSNFETRADDAYQDRHDPAVTVLFDLDPAGFPVEGDGPVRILAWTTTPWTLPSNLALAVGPDIEYAVYLEDDVRYVSARTPRPKYERELADAVCVATIPGSRARRPQLHAAVPVLRRHAQRLPGAGRRLRVDRGGHRRRPPGARDSARTTSGSARRPASRWCARSTAGAGSPPRCPTSRASRSSTPTPR